MARWCSSGRSGAGTENHGPTGRTQRSPPSIRRTSSGMPTSPLDVADLGLLRQLEDGHVPALELHPAQAAEEGEDDAPASSRRSGRRKSLVRRRRAASNRQFSQVPNATRGAGAAAVPLGLGLSVGVDGIDVAAFRAGDLLVPAHQRSAPSSRSGSRSPRPQGSRAGTPGRPRRTTRSTRARPTAAASPGPIPPGPPPDPRCSSSSPGLVGSWIPSDIHRSQNNNPHRPRTGLPLPHAGMPGRRLHGVTIVERRCTPARGHARAPGRCDGRDSSLD